jgi:hypothetical protein
MFVKNTKEISMSKKNCNHCGIVILGALLLLPLSVFADSSQIYPGHSCRSNSYQGNDTCFLPVTYNNGLKNNCGSTQAALCPLYFDPTNYDTFAEAALRVDTTTGTTCYLSRIKYNGTSGAHYSPDSTTGTSFYWTTDRDLTYQDGGIGYNYVYSFGCNIAAATTIYSYSNYLTP